MTNTKLLFWGGIALTAFLLFRACTVQPSSSQQVPSALPVAEGSVESPAPTTDPRDDITIQRDQLLDNSLDASQKLVGQLLCTRKEQFLLEAKLYQQDAKGSAEKYLLGKVKQTQSLALDLNTKSGTLTGTSREVQSATPIIIDSYAALLAYQEVTGGKPSIGMCSVNLADALIPSQQMIQLATLLERASNEAKVEEIKHGD